MNYFVSDLPDSDFVPADLEREGEYVAEGEEDGDPFDGEDERNVQGTHSCFFFLKMCTLQGIFMSIMSFEALGFLVFTNNLVSFGGHLSVYKD